MNFGSTYAKIYVCFEQNGFCNAKFRNLESSGGMIKICWWNPKKYILILFRTKWATKLHIPFAMSALGVIQKFKKLCDACLSHGKMTSAYNTSSC